MIGVEKYSLREQEILRYLNSNGEPGLSVGFQSLEGLYSHRSTGITDWTGFPASGKTYFVLELLITLSEKYGQRHALFVPDLGNYKETWSKIFMMVSGKEFNAKYGNKATEDDIHRHKDWINHHFIILKREDIKKPITPINIWEYVCHYEDSAGIINNCLIDSWKNLYHNLDGRREDLYLDYVLNYRNELAEAHDKHFHTIAHAAKTEIDEYNVATDTDGRTKKKRRVPDANDIKGGGSWFASGKNIITVDFPDKKRNSLDIHISKTKPEGVGSVGSVLQRICLDYNRHRYYEMVNGEKRFTFTKAPAPLPANTNFDNEKYDENPF